MKRISIGIITLMVLIIFGYPVKSDAQETSEKTGELTVPWDEFKKLLNLDENELVIPMETFQKLLAQTGAKVPPPHIVREGNVVLTREEFKKLVDQMKPPVEPATLPPFNYLTTKAIYTGKMRNANTAFTGIFNVHVLKKDTYMEIPILSQSLALEDIRVNDQPALVVSKNGYHHVVLSQAGEYEVTASFSVKSSLDKGPHKIDFAILQTPITLLNLEMPLKDIDVEIPQAQEVITRTRDNTTVISAVVSPGHAISVRWRKQVAIAEKIPPKLYSEVYHLVSIEDDVLKIKSDIQYNILHSEVDIVQLAIPEGMNVLAVYGEGLGEWQEVTQDGERLIVIPFTYGKKGATTVSTTTEVPLSETGMANLFAGLKVLNTVREIGFIGIELNTSAEVGVSESEGLEKVAPQKLPAALIQKSDKPLIMGFKYLKHPYNLVLDITKHEKIEVPVATVNSANIVTLFTEDGKIVHRLVYQIRNSAKQFLEIQLPENANVWSVFVGNQPVESSISREGTLLVPLIRSRSIDNRLDTFPVEVIIALSESRFSRIGSLESFLPAVDLMTSQLIWSVYLPNDYAYIYFSSTLEKEEMIRGLNLFAGSRRQYNEKAMREYYGYLGEETEEVRRDKLLQSYEGKEYQSRFRNVPLEEGQMSSQMDAELEFGGRLEDIVMEEAPPSTISGGTTTGVLPIQIQIPTGGQVYRFARTIIETEDPLTFRVVYAQLWVIRLIKWVVFIFVVTMLITLRKRLKAPLQWIGAQWNLLVNSFNKNKTHIERFSRSAMTPFVLFGLLVVFWTISGFLSLLFLFLLWISVVYHFLHFRRKRAEKRKNREKGNEKEGSAENV